MTRTKVLTITVYHGTLPDQYELLTPQFIPWLAPTAGQEYMLFIEKTFAGENDMECSGVSVPGLRAPGQRCFTQRELDAMGGPGGFYIGEQAWIVEGGKAWRIPDNPSRPLTVDYDLIKAAQTEGEILSLSELETAIRAGLKK